MSEIPGIESLPDGEGLRRAIGATLSTNFQYEFRLEGSPLWVYLQQLNERDIACYPQTGWEYTTTYCLLNERGLIQIRDGRRYLNHRALHSFFEQTPRPARPTWDHLGMETARVWAKRSVDEKVRVGSCIISNESHTVVGIGFNGRHPGSKVESRFSSEIGGSLFVHSEANALLRARWAEGETHTIAVTHEPCCDCALLILAARRITRVIYETPYLGDGKRPRGSEILKEAGIEVIQWTQ